VVVHCAGQSLLRTVGTSTRANAQGRAAPSSGCDSPVSKEIGVWTFCLTPLVYVIDDDLSMRKAIGRLLESEDYPVELLNGGAPGGVVSWLGLPHTGPSCVILDLNMPG